MDRIKNNRLIAEFMGYVIQKNPSERWFGRYFKPGYGWVKENELFFHSDWNWLMEVAEKIYQTNLYYDKYIDYNSSMFSSGKIEFSTNISKVYEQVIEFIKWYNEQNK